MIVDHNHWKYLNRWRGMSTEKFNGAYYYAKEISRNIIPNVRTDRNWILLNVKGECANHSIVFIHNNRNIELYDWLKQYDDLILVCGVYETCQKIKHLGTPIHLPISVDVAEVEKFKVDEKTKDVAFVGRKGKRKYDSVTLPENIDYIEGLPREKLLQEMAKYRKVYAVGRTAIEAKILGCQILPYDSRFPNPRRWKIFDNKDAAEMLQEKLNKIDGE